MKKPEPHHIIRVRYANGTHQAVSLDGVTCTSTSGHEQAAQAVLVKVYGTGYVPVRDRSKEPGLVNTDRPSWEQWQVYRIEPKSDG